MPKHTITYFKTSIFVYTGDIMSLQSPTNGIPPCFGERLRLERKRLGMTQGELAAVGGVQRLAQLQYETERTAPTTKYLSAIGGVGVDLSYLMLGVRFSQATMSNEQAARVEEKVFEWIQVCANYQPDGKMSPETFAMLFRVFKGFLSQVELGALPAEFDPASLLGGRAVNSRN